MSEAALDTKMICTNRVEDNVITCPAVQAAKRQHDPASHPSHPCDPSLQQALAPLDVGAGFPGHWCLILAQGKL